MNLRIADKSSFLTNFLIPVSKVTNSAVLKLKGSTLSTLISTSDNTVILSSIFTLPDQYDELTLNIPDLTKLVRILSVIDKDDLTLDISGNYIAYKSEDIRFKYHLFEDGIIMIPKLSIEKLNNLTFDGKFNLSYPDIINLIKGSSVATDTNKIYLTFKDGTVTGELTDKTRPNVDSYGLKISSSYSGPQLATPTPLNFEIFRIISSMKFKELNCSFSTKIGVFVFDTTLTNAQIKFVVSALAS